jgi:hypothetical protein
MTLELSPPHANAPFIVLTAHAASARLEEGITLQVRIHLTCLLSLFFICLELIMISAPHPELHLMLAHLTYLVQSKVSS